ncbi:hypothetical protein GCM10027055_02440 [Janibacter alkaliphilus]|uniref:Putative transcriptional regulator n=1 Tax=Janibacter alkaliphilus TaxID=1069963 RepID=A0A852X348_9MICO|nr:ribbon-helix-helix protein, CopG family [Janibacter alkaliphilus]NYG36858.1 putative transcriptional regulator [Janibacter alkaliphilus]
MAFTLRTDSELEAALDTLATSEGVSRQEVVRRAILERADILARRRDIDTVLDQELPRYADALRRLGE